MGVLPLAEAGEWAVYCTECGTVWVRGVHARKECPQCPPRTRELPEGVEVETHADVPPKANYRANGNIKDCHICQHPVGGPGLSICSAYHEGVCTGCHRCQKECPAGAHGEQNEECVCVGNAMVRKKKEDERDV